MKTAVLLLSHFRITAASRRDTGTVCGCCRGLHSLAELGLSCTVSCFYPYIRLSGILPGAGKTLPVSATSGEHAKGLRCSQTAGAGRLFIPETLPFIWTKSLLRRQTSPAISFYPETGCKICRRRTVFYLLRTESKRAGKREGGDSTLTFEVILPP